MKEEEDALIVVPTDDFKPYSPDKTPKILKELEEALPVCTHWRISGHSGCVKVVGYAHNGRDCAVMAYIDANGANPGATIFDIDPDITKWTECEAVEWQEPTPEQLAQTEAAALSQEILDNMENLPSSEVAESY